MDSQRNFDVYPWVSSTGTFAWHTVRYLFTTLLSSLFAPSLSLFCTNSRFLFSELIFSLNVSVHWFETNSLSLWMMHANLSVSFLLYHFFITIDKWSENDSGTRKLLRGFAVHNECGWTSTHREETDTVGILSRPRLSTPWKLKRALVEWDDIKSIYIFISSSGRWISRSQCSSLIV